METIDAERTCIELELTHVKAERDTVVKKLTAAQTTCKELSAQWEKLQEAGTINSVSDSLSEPKEIAQKLKCAENQVWYQLQTTCLSENLLTRNETQHI